MINQIRLTRATMDMYKAMRPAWLVCTAIAAPEGMRSISPTVNEKINVRGHQGGISFVSEPSQGSTFTVLCPYLDPRTNALVNPEAQEPVIDTAKVKKTLVIDDEADVRDVLEDFLTYYGVQVLQAESGLAGLDILRRDLTAVDLVILDLSMPGMNGVETRGHIRQMTAPLPIIISSGYSQQSIETQLAQDPQIRFLGKPYTYPQLCRTIESLIN